MNLTDEEVAVFRQECLDQHNYYRQLHHCPPLKLEKHLSSSATFWAKQISERGRLIFLESPDYGQNVFKSESLDISGKHPVRSWYQAIKYFDFHSPRHNRRAQNFMQIVWKDSEELGIGVAVKDDSLYVVANYRPRYTFDARSIRENIRASKFPPPISTFDLVLDILREEYLVYLLMQLYFELKELLQ